MLAKSLNPWGKQGGIEPQRADLWVINLERAVHGIRSVYGDDVELPPRDHTRYYARQIIFPDVSMSTVDSKRHSVPVEYPGYDDPIGHIRVDLLVDAGHTDESGYLMPQRGSKIFNLIRYWHALARVGRVARSNSSEFESKPLKEAAVSYASMFKFDVIVSLFSGTDIAPLSSVTDVGTISHFPTPGMKSTTTFKLNRCWVKAYQIGNLDIESNSMLKLTVTLVAEDIIPTGTTGYL